MNSETHPQGEPGGSPNRLIHEKSPYLLQHARNPVDWYPWAPAALDRAVAEDRPILVSIGYATCHWCHVMERESFSDPNVAGFMNSRFICIKVDREERPDLDQIYMTAVTSMTGSGGWPLNVFLTPDRRPFFGGTYFPPHASVGMSSWLQVLQAVAAAWENPAGRRKIRSAAGEVSGMLQRIFEPAPEPPAVHGELPEKAVKQYEAVFDPRQGGFSGAPKFPSPAIQSFLLDFHRLTANGPAPERIRGESARRMALTTLRFMARGGIYDQIGGGFHRYATDDRWFVPHFEKMLYDNAQLIVNYLAAYEAGGGNFYRTVAEETADYLLRDMQHPGGGFYSAQDADSLPPEDDGDATGRKAEGAFYTWREDGVRASLGNDLAADLFCYRFGVLPGGNVDVDPHGDFRGKNILYRAHSIEACAARFEMTPTEVDTLLRRAKETLFEIRSRRSRPHTDDKVLTDWNGLAISALAKAFRVTGGKRYLDGAVRGARFIQERLYDASSGMLFRRWRDGDRTIGAMAADYAFFIQGLIDLQEADGRPEWLQRAEEMTERQMKWFHDSDRGGFYMTRPDHDPYLILRPREEVDSVVPSAGSVSVLNLLRLFEKTGRRAYLQAADRAMSRAAGKLARYPTAAPTMLQAFGKTRTMPRAVSLGG